jgi:hypothetical protein
MAQPWSGLVFMNPPFGRRKGHTPWLERFLRHANGVAIVRAYTSSGWWHQYMPRAEGLLFPRGKTKFIRPDGSIGRAPGHGIVLVGMGDVALDAMRRSKLGMFWDRRTCEVSRERAAAGRPIEERWRSAHDRNGARTRSAGIQGVG